ncbi:MAG: hypothetical protein A4E69_00743 [Syntrophus sp. PtaB.Bin138]|nr:MAG: hypothetical protein A4E69_00743 [Syntrophus sp. PtaB.Bin138]
MEKGKPVLHGTHEDDDTEHGADGKPEFQVLDFPDPRGGDGVFLKLVDDPQEFVSLVDHRFLQSRHPLPDGFMEDRGPGRGQIDRHILHALHFFQGVFDAAHTGGTGHPADGNRCFFQPSGGRAVDFDDLITQFPDPLGKLFREYRRGIEVHNGLFQGEIDGGLFDPRHFPQSLLNAAHAGSAAHSGDMKDCLIRQLRTPPRKFFV